MGAAGKLDQFKTFQACVCPVLNMLLGFGAMGVTLYMNINDSRQPNRYSDEAKQLGLGWWIGWYRIEGID